MLQDATVEVDHVDATIRSIVYANRADARVGGAEKLALLEVLARKKLVGHLCRGPFSVSLNQWQVTALAAGSGMKAAPA